MHVICICAVARAADKHSRAKHKTKSKSKYSFHNRASLKILYLFAQNKLISPHERYKHVVGTGSALRGAVICFYLSNEALSLFENAAHIGLPIPDKLREALAQLHGRDGKDNTTDQRDKGDGE